MVFRLIVFPILLPEYDYYYHTTLFSPLDRKSITLKTHLRKSGSGFERKAMGAGPAGSRAIAIPIDQLHWGVPYKHCETSPEICFGYSFDVELSDLSISEVYEAQLRKTKKLERFEKKSNFCLKFYRIMGYRGSSFT